MLSFVFIGSIMIIMLLGPPGAGKGTNSDLICNKYGLSHISTGDILRERSNSNDDVAKQISEIMKAGKLIPDEMVNDLLAETIDNSISKIDYKGLLFDGYPRTVSQAIFLESIFSKINQKLDCVFVFNVSDNIVITRNTARRVDKTTGKIYNLISMPPPPEVVDNLLQRADDTEEAIKNRLIVYKEQAKKLLEYYSKSNLVKNIDVSKTIEEIQKDINTHLEILE